MSVPRVQRVLTGVEFGGYKVSLDGEPKELTFRAIDNEFEKRRFEQYQGAILLPSGKRRLWVKAPA